MKRATLALSLTILFVALASGCSIQRLAINSLSGVLESGDLAFASDNDPDLVAQALPFSLKLIDGLLLSQPDHQGLLVAAASGYVSYAYAFIDLPAERVSLNDIDAARAMRARARNLFLRAHSYAMHALELDHPGVGANLERDPKGTAALLGADPDEIATLYWTAASLGLAISSSRNEPALLARLPEVEALLDRLLEIDESWNDGALHDFAIAMAGVRDTDATTLRSHFERALALSSGHRASLFVAYAEATAVPAQDRQAFVALLDRALAIDVDAYPEQRLANVLAQRRAQWLLSSLDELFLE